MFDIVDSLQGPSRAAVDSDDDAKGQASSSSSAAAEQQPASEPAGRFSLWGMATALAENVKKSTADIAARCGTVFCDLVLCCQLQSGIVNSSLGADEIQYSPFPTTIPGLMCMLAMHLLLCLGMAPPQLPLI